MYVAIFFAGLLKKDVNVCRNKIRQNNATHVAVSHSVKLAVKIGWLSFFCLVALRRQSPFIGKDVW